MARYFYIFLFLNLVVLTSSAQTFRGKVIDASGNPIPYAAIYIKELQSGFATDDQGSFQTNLKEGSYTCNVSSLGYATQVMQLLMPDHDLEKNFILKERVYALREVSVVKGAEDPAYAVMRNAIAYAPYYRTQVKGFKAGTYLKGTGKMKSIPAILKLSKEVRKESKKWMGKLFVLEEQKFVTFKAPDTWDIRVKAYRNSFPEDGNVSVDVTTINFYEPTLFDKISPLSNKAFSFYRFQLDGCYVENNHMINKIRVIPKRDNPKLVKGEIYIVENLWCVSAVNLQIDAGGLKANIKSSCNEVEPSVFLPTSTSMSCTISMLGFKAEAFYLSAVHYNNVEVAKPLVALTGQTKIQQGDNDAEPLMPSPGKKESGKHPLKTETTGEKKIREKIEKLSSKEKLTTREAYKLAKLMEKSIVEDDTTRAVSTHKFERQMVESKEHVKTDSLAGKRDSLYWASVRIVPLLPEETQSYIRKKQELLSDTVSVKKEGRSSGGNRIWDTFWSGNTFQTKKGKAWIAFSGLTSYVPEYNFVDGFWLGTKVRTGIRFSKASSLSFTPSFYYTTARKSVVGTGDLTLQYAPRRGGKLTLNGGVVSADYNEESGESRLINALSSSLFGRNDVKLYDKRFLSIGNEIELANSLLLSSSLSWQRRKMLVNHISQSWFKKKAESNFPDNPSFTPMEDNNLLRASFALEYTPAHYYHMSGRKKVYETSRYPTFTLHYDKAFALGGNDVSPSYHRLEFSARQKIEFGMFNSICWNVNAGTFWKASQMQFADFKHFATTTLLLTGRSFDEGFSLLDNYEYSTKERWAQANFSWYTPYLFLKQLPFLRRKAFNEAIHIRTLLIHDRHPYSEIGYSVGFSTILRTGIFVSFDRFRSCSTGVSITLSLSDIL